MDHPVPAVLFCPKVIYNAATGLYVLWYNWLDATVTHCCFTAYDPLCLFRLLNGRWSRDIM